MTGNTETTTTRSLTDRVNAAATTLRNLKIPALAMTEGHEWNDNKNVRVLVAAPDTHLVFRATVNDTAIEYNVEVEWVDELPEYTPETPSKDPIPDAREFSDVTDLTNGPQTGGRTEALTGF